MEKRRTVPVKLDVDSPDAALLEDTIDEFLWAAIHSCRQPLQESDVPLRVLNKSRPANNI
jgi:hypothetical protein